jgi:hypothetical protein
MQKVDALMDFKSKGHFAVNAFPYDLKAQKIDLNC